MVKDGGPMFIPATPGDMRERGWDSLDVIIVSGDAYIDSPYNGAAIIGHWLIEHGFRVGMIPQPSLDSEKDILSLGTPNLFWSITAGSVDSMVANYTASKKFRKEDDFTPGGLNDRRPDRACIAYTNLIKKHAKGKPIILGGIEASLRRVAHYDFWSDKVRRSILFDAKADAVTYGMGELTNLELARRMRDGKDWAHIDGLCIISKDAPSGYGKMPSYEECVESKEAFMRAFEMFHLDSEPANGRGLVQRHGDRYLVQNKPRRNLTPDELDRVYGMDYEYAVHPISGNLGHVRAMDTIRNSITTHRGCFGSCSFCAVHAMQGREVVSRSEDSVVAEAERLASRPGFDGIIRDIGGPTANMYGMKCRGRICDKRKCLTPKPCPNLLLSHRNLISLMSRVRAVEGVRKAFVASGVRHDLVTGDKASGTTYLRELCDHHVSGQMKVAPEHVSPRILELMGKPGPEGLLEFKEAFDGVNAELGKEQYMTYYFMAAHPGCNLRDMEELSAFCRNRLRTNPGQVQVFTPTPSTASTAMYYTGLVPFSGGKEVMVTKSPGGRQRQKDVVVPKQ